MLIDFKTSLLYGMNVHFSNIGTSLILRSSKLWYIGEQTITVNTYYILFKIVLLNWNHKTDWASRYILISMVI
jgi:hypothetical protein